MTQLVLIRGIAGSGKSTLARTQFKHLKHFETDMFFMKNGTYQFKPFLLPQAHAWCQEQTYNALHNGDNVVVSNTFTTHAEMKPYIDMAKELDVQVNILTATGEYDSIHDVPPEAIQRMKDRWED